MSMSSYNRQNPFMYLTEVKQDELQTKSEKALKCMIFMSILAFFEIVANIVCDVLYRTLYIESILTTIFLVIFIFLEIRYCIRNVKNSEMNEMIFGDEFQYINLNNEKLLSMINNFNTSIGRIEIVIETIYLIDVLFLSLLSFHTIRILAFIL